MLQTARKSTRQRSFTTGPVLRLRGAVLVVMLCGCGPDDYQVGPTAATPIGGSRTVAAVPASVSPASACFSEAKGFETKEDGTVTDSTGMKLTPLPLSGEADEIAASSEDFCGKWANDAQLKASAFQYVFKTNADCARRALGGDFVQLGFGPDSEGVAEFVRGFVACEEPVAMSMQAASQVGAETDEPSEETLVAATVTDEPWQAEPGVAGVSTSGE